MLAHTQNMYTDVFFNTSCWSAAYTLEYCSIIHFHTVNTQCPILSNFKAGILPSMKIVKT